MWGKTMLRKNISALFAGLLFGIGLILSGMTNPSKVLGFLDIFGNWDPSLMFVMIGAIGVSFFAFRKASNLTHTVIKEPVQLPAAKQVDKSLIIGSLLFGIGWGMIGLCPGPAMASLAVGGFDLLLFVMAMIIGMEIYRLLSN